MSAMAHRVLWTVLAALVAGGCVRPAGLVFEPLENPPVWPLPPEPARIRYVGQLATSADLKPAVGLAEALGEVVLGRKPIRSMLTPFAVCTDGGQRLFVADSNGQMVRMLNLETRTFTDVTPGNREKRFSMPVGVAWDPAGRLLVADSVAAVVYAFDDAGREVATLGATVLKRPTGLAVDAARGRVLVADAGLHQVLVFDRGGELLRRVGQRGVGLGEFNYPTHVATGSAGEVFVTDALNFRVQVFDAELRPVRAFGRKGDMPGYFGQPKGLSVDRHGHVYVVDAQFEAVQIFDAEGRLLLVFGQEGRRAGEFWLPTGVWVDGRDRIWVADSYNRRVQVFDALPAPETAGAATAPEVRP